MTFDQQDLRRLQAPLLLFAISALIAAVAVWAALDQQRQTRQAHVAALATDREIAGKLAGARNEESELREKIARFQALKARGLIGAERRLDWVEIIGRIRAARRLAQIDYEFSPQRPIDAAILPGGAAAGALTLKASQMQFRLPLLHEGDLLGFIDDLRANAPAWIQVRRCAIGRAPDAVDRAVARLAADCTLEWISFSEAA
uniref:Uncharacterized protein n=1 Tax=uncultured bacterium UPO35 TaxID=1776962 RepID=A0A126SXG9_9BACT|nr:hypothetical protein METUNv1_02409 [uncultured bacterium UPO35]